MAEVGITMTVDDDENSRWRRESMLESRAKESFQLEEAGLITGCETLANTLLHGCRNLFGLPNFRHEKSGHAGAMLQLS